MLNNWIVVLFLLVFSVSVDAAKTYIVVNDVDVFDAEQGETVTIWQQGTLFTSSSQNDLWIKVSGHFPKGQWRALPTPFFVKKNDKVIERIPYQNAGGRTLVYPALEERYVNTDARKFKLLESATVYEQNPLLTPNAMSEINVDIWQRGKVFTSNYQSAELIKVTGLVDEGNWVGLEQPLWITKPVKIQDRTLPKGYQRDPSAVRFAVIDKVKFHVNVYEVLDENVKKLMRAPVALGYDRCLSKEKGGQCYYTPEGEFDIEFKLFDPDGIHWCIPPKMAAEYKTKIAKGERCWRGVMGRHALHFGNSLFLHGTSNPNSIGGNTTHGCVRLRNSDISMVYRLLTKGDKVLISETPAQFDLLAMAKQHDAVKNPPPVLENTDSDSLQEAH